MKSDNTKTLNVKRLSIAVPIIGVILAAAMIIGANITRANAQDDLGNLTSISMKQASALPKNSPCAPNSATVKGQVQRINGLNEEAGPWTSYIYDVPAGTNVDVNIASYSGEDTVTGSLIYSDNYGSYNFTLTKQSGGWRYTAFTGCNR